MISCSTDEKEKAEKDIVDVKTIIAAKQKLIIPLRSAGIVKTASEVLLAFKTGGIISRINVNEGDKVSKGQLLAELELEEIESKLRQASLSKEKAFRDFQRVENLYNDRVATLENYQDAKTALGLAKANLEIAEYNLKYSVIRAPGNGNILHKFAEENELIASGHPVILFGSTASDWVVEVNLADQQAVLVALGDSARIFIDAWPGKIFKGKITKIASAADPYTGTFTVRISLENENDKLFSGLVAKAEIFAGKGKDFILLPVDALTDANDYTASVFVVEDNKPVKKRIRLGRITGDNVIVESGLATGEEVVTDGSKYLDDESMIRISN